jgi:hypothetical protein
MSPVLPGHKPELDVTPELKADWLQHHQEMIGVLLRWSVEIRRIDILLETSAFSVWGVWSVWAENLTAD